VLRKLFGKTNAVDARSGSPTILSGPRVPRHSSAWAAMHKHLQQEPNLRILDIGPTSPSNINFLTGLGHSVYMADIVHEAMKPEWLKVVKEGDGSEVEQFDTEAFLEHNLEFSGRLFDVVLLWTTLDYLPDAMIGPVIDRFRASLLPGGRILALFHTKKVGEDTAYCRYHLTASDNVEVQESERFPVQRVYTNRSIEKLFSDYSNCKFFLAKDNVYEVIISR